MPGPVRTCLFTAILLAAALAAVAPARADMTEVDKAGQRAFAACLDETGGEEACTDKLGRYAWYPHDNAVCEVVATFVHKIITDGAQVEWHDLFFNERCARLHLPHDREAAAAGDTDPQTLKSSPEGKASRQIFVDCLDGKHWNDEACYEKVGRHRWYDEEIYCGLTGNIVKLSAKNREIQSWKLLFMNERCHRMGVWHYEPAQ